MNTGTKKNPGKYSCLSKIKPDEPFFILRAQDAMSYRSVIEWIKDNPQVPDDKLREAFECALAMKNYPHFKAAD